MGIHMSASMEWIATCPAQHPADEQCTKIKVLHKLNMYALFLATWVQEAFLVLHSLEMYPLDTYFDQMQSYEQKALQNAAIYFVPGL